MQASPEALVVDAERLMVAKGTPNYSLFIRVTGCSLLHSVFNYDPAKTVFLWKPGESPINEPHYVRPSDCCTTSVLSSWSRLLKRPQYIADHKAVELHGLFEGSARARLYCIIMVTSLFSFADQSS